MFIEKDPLKHFINFIRNFLKITNYILEGKLKFHLALKNNGNIIKEKNFLAETSISYSVDDIKND